MSNRKKVTPKIVQPSYFNKIKPKILRINKKLTTLNLFLQKNTQTIKGVRKIIINAIFQKDILDNLSSIHSQLSQLLRNLLIQID